MAGNMKDFATGIVVTAPTPASSGTSLTLQTGEGSRMPATPFYATAHPPAQYPTLDTAEKIQVTNVTDDTLTIVRAQGETTAKDIEPGWRVSNTLFLDNLANSPDDVGLGNVDNTSDANKPVSTATQAALDGKANSSHTHPTTDLTATGGTSTSFLRKDNTWATPTNTTYTEITEAEITAGTASTARAISGRRAEFIAQKAITAVAADSNIIRKTDSSISGAAWLAAVGTATDKATTPNAVKTYVDSAIGTTVLKSDTSTASMGFVVDEDDMASDSATKVPTQQSVKSYVDSKSSSSSGRILIGNMQILFGNFSSNSDGVAHTFPYPFASTPVVTTDVTAGDPSQYYSYIRALNSTTLTVKINAGVSGNRTVHYIAIGPAA